MTFLKLGNVKIGFLKLGNVEERTRPVSLKYKYVLVINVRFDLIIKGKKERSFSARIVKHILTGK